MVHGYTREKGEPLPEMLTSFSFQVQWLLYCGWVFFLPATRSFFDWNRSPLKNVVTFAKKQSATSVARQRSRTAQW